MKFKDLDNTYQSNFESQILQKMEILKSRFVFPNENIVPNPLNEEETEILISQLGINSLSCEFTTEFDGKIVKISDKSNSSITVTLDKIIAQRNKNLLEETMLVKAPNPPYDRVLHNVVCECGFATDIKTLLLTAKSYGLKTCWGARPSCGAADLINVDETFEDANICTVGFQTEEGDVIEVLYLGKYTSNVELIDRAVCRLASMPGFDFEITPTLERKLY